MKVLIADDDSISRSLVKVLLTKWGYEVMETGDGHDAWCILQEDESLRLLVIDWMMPGLSGPELCQRLRASGDKNYHYIIMLTGRDSKEDIIDGLNAGADDYITKPFSPQELEVRLRTGRRILDLQESLQKTLDIMRHQAQHDPLTGILNHGEILKVLEQELTRAERQNSKLAVMMGDLDHFKKVNDSYGHVAGDAVLVEVARRMRMDIRSYDTLGRYGGEEFLLVLPGCAAEEARQIANRILDSIRREAVEFQGHKIFVTISLGLAFNEAGQSTALIDIVQAADSALYAAKQNGRDRYEIMMK